MARELNKLTVRGITAITKSGRHGDGGGLYLTVDKSGGKRWVFLFRQDGRLREMGLGGLQNVSLAKARGLAQEARAAIAEGRDPINDRNAKKDIPTFGEIADEVLDSLKVQWRNKKHIAQWEMTLRDYAKPLRGKPVNTIVTSDVLAVLKPLWLSKPETASRLRGRIERVLDAAKAHGHRTGENPAAWRGHLKNLLPARQKLTRGHHAAMLFTEIHALVERLRENRSVSALALEFTILTASRSGEVLGARWSEIDENAALWTIPAHRMKAGRQHRVPLSTQTLTIIKAMADARISVDGDDYIFAGQKPGRPLSNMSMQMLLRRMKLTDVTVHGFRSSFRDWVGEATTFQREVAEAALAHVVGDETERAYRRGDALIKRRELMNAWAYFVEAGSPSNVIELAAFGEHVR